MATYAGVKLAEEPHLRKIVEGMVVAPLPPGWTEDEDTAGEGRGRGRGRGRGVRCTARILDCVLLFILVRVVEFDAKLLTTTKFCLASLVQRWNSS